MSGYPHGLSAPTEIKPVLHIIDWQEDGVARVMWCGTKFLFDDPLVLEAGETKPCPVCGMELHHDEKKKGVVEFPKLSPTETGGQMNDKVRETLRSIDEMLYVQETDSATKPCKTCNGVGTILHADRSRHSEKCPDYTADAPPSTNPDTSVDGEPTDKMVAYVRLRRGLRTALWRDDFWPNNPGVGDDEIVDAVDRLIEERAALAVQHQGEG